MSDYIVSARKYRPKAFESVVGQENITQTLAKAIEKNQLGSSFLFCGPRGVGKTTCARILAREVNKFHSDNPENDPDFAFNIFELDAASNNGVEGIRDLIDQVRIPPQTGKYKVYIIDEVHMLSTSAFNAFLKTLEEPPPYAIFILATTEKHKILPTIISRCQVFDFNRIEVKDIVKQLTQIAEAEGIATEPEALHLIAEKADGAMRDALSIFDRLASSSSGEGITYAATIDNLNILDHEYFFRMVEAALAGDRAEMMLIYDSIVRAGFEGSNFSSGLANHLRNLLMAVSAKTVDIIVSGETLRQRYLEQAALCTTEQLVQGLEILGTVNAQYKASQNQRLLVEIALLKICEIYGRDKKKTEYPSPGGGNAESAPVNPGPQRVAPQAKEKAAMPPEPAPAQTQTPAREPAPAPEPEPVSAAVGQAPESKAEAQPGGSSGNTRPESQSTLREKDATPPPANGRDTSSQSVREQESSPYGAEKSPKTETPLREDSPKTKDTPPPASAAKTPGASPLSDRLKGVQVKGISSLKDLKKKREETSRVENKQGEESTEPDIPEGPMTPFTTQDLWEAWDAYAARIKAMDKPSYHATLTARKPVIREPLKIEFLVDNHVQLSDLNEDRPDLLEFLRDRLDNRGIQLEGSVAEVEGEAEANPYDPRKKFAKMNSTNPALQKLRSAFDLDIEHDF